MLHADFVHYVTHLNLWRTRGVKIEEEMFWFLLPHYCWCVLSGSQSEIYPLQERSLMSEQL